MRMFAILFVLGALSIVGLHSARPALAMSGVCGAPNSGSDTPTVDDALFVLSAAAGNADCAPCECDVNSSGSISASDALLVFAKSVGQAVTLTCAACAASPGTPPIASLPVVVVEDLDSDGDYDQDDIDLGMAECAPGCNLRLLARTYTDVQLVIGGAVSQGFALYGAGAGQTILEARVTHPGGRYNTAILLAGSAPAGIILQDFTLDGLKHQQAIFTQVGNGSFGETWRHLGVATDSQQRVRNTIVRRLHVKNFLSTAISVRGAENWIVEDNTLTDMGCHTIDNPCGPEWSRVPFNTTIPGLKANGFGVQVSTNSIGSLVQRNTISGVTKHGIEIFGSCAGDPSVARNTIIRQNSVDRATEGIVVNNGCNYLIEDNHVQRSGRTGTENLFVGNGFLCADGCRDGIWRRNVSTNNQLSGFHFHLSGDNVDILDNISSDNCVTSTYPFGDLHVRRWDQGGGRNIRIVDNVVMDNNCNAGLVISRLTNVIVSGGSIEGGRNYGAWIESGTEVEIRDVSLIGQPSEKISRSSNSQVGIYFQGNAGLVQNFLIQPSVAIEGFQDRLRFAPGTRSGVSDCANEPQPSASCDNAAP